MDKTKKGIIIKDVVKELMDGEKKSTQRSGHQQKKRVTLFLKPETAKRLKVAAAIRGLSMSELIEQLVTTNATSLISEEQFEHDGQP